MSLSPIPYVDLIGVPFVYNGRDTTHALDCYGLVLELYRRIGITLPDYRTPDHEAATIAQLFTDGVVQWRRCELKPGAALLIRLSGYHWHVGIYLGNDRFIHTTEDTGGVTVERLSVWHRKIEGFYDFVGN